MSVVDSNARCLKAVELTFRFVLKNFICLFFLLLAICIVFKNGYEPGVDVGLAIVVLYFTVAYRHYGRGNKASLIIAGLAGLSVAGAAAAVSSINDGDWDSESDSPTEFMMGGFDAMGSPNGVGVSPDVFSSGDSMSDDFHHSINPVNGLPMVNDAMDVHGNIYGTNSIDDFMNSSNSLFDDSLSHSSFDNSAHSHTFDDDWNK